MKSVCCSKATATALFLSVIFGVGGCSSENTFEGIAGTTVQIQITAASSVDRSLWQFLSARTLQDDQVVDQICLPYNIISEVPEIQVPTTGGFEMEVNIFTGENVCSAGGGGILLARGVLPHEGIDLESPTPASLLISLAPAGAFVETSFILGGAETTPQESRFGAGFVHLPNHLIMAVGGGDISEGTSWDTPITNLSVWTQSDALTNLRTTIELYNVKTGEWTLLGAEESSLQKLPKGRMFSSLVYLEDRNMVAVVGGYESNENGDVVPATDIILIDLATMTPLPEAESGGTLLPRIGATVDRLEAEEGSLLFIAGGIGDEPSLSYEVIRPGPVGPSGQEHVRGFGALPRARWNHTSTHLTSKGNVEQIYLVGGETTTSLVKLIDVFDVEGKQFFAAPAGADAVAGLSESGKVGHATVFVSSLNALYVIGGYTSKDRSTQTPRIEVIEVDTGAALTGDADSFNLVRARGNHRAIAIDDRRVLVTGGITNEQDSSPILTPADEWIGSTGIDSITGDDVVSAQSFPGMKIRRAGHNLVSLSNGQFLVFGGFRLLEGLKLESIPVGPGSHNSELYTPIPYGEP